MNVAGPLLAGADGMPWDAHGLVSTDTAIRFKQVASDRVYTASGYPDFNEGVAHSFVTKVKRKGPIVLPFSVPNGKYRVVAYIAEPVLKYQQLGKRVNKLTSGTRSLQYDVYAAAGSKLLAVAVVKLEDITVETGVLVVQVEGIQGQPILSGIEIYAASSGAAATVAKPQPATVAKPLPTTEPVPDVVAVVAPVTAAAATTVAATVAATKKELGVVVAASLVVEFVLLGKGCCQSDGPIEVHKTPSSGALSACKDMCAANEKCRGIEHKSGQLCELHMAAVKRKSSCSKTKKCYSASRGATSLVGDKETPAQGSSSSSNGIKIAALVIAPVLVLAVLAVAAILFKYHVPQQSNELSADKVSTPSDIVDAAKGPQATSGSTASVSEASGSAASADDIPGDGIMFNDACLASESGAKLKLVSPAGSGLAWDASA